MKNATAIVGLILMIGGAASSRAAEGPLAEGEGACIDQCRAQCADAYGEPTCLEDCSSTCNSMASTVAPKATTASPAKATAVTSATAPRATQAQEPRRPRMPSLANPFAVEKKDDESHKALVTPVGLYAFVGGGATNFTEPTAVGATWVGGYWDARVGVGTRSIIGAEVAYVGSARNIEALGLNSDAFLLGNGLEGVARLNVPVSVQSFLIEPYTFGGVGWQRYNLMTDSSNTSSIDDQDDVVTVPLGLGFSAGYSGFTLDIRGTYRHALGSDLFGSQTSSFANTSMNSWGAGASLGFEL